MQVCTPNNFEHKISVEEGICLLIQEANYEFDTVYIPHKQPLVVPP